MNRRILVLDDEKSLLEAYRALFSPAPVRMVASSRHTAAAMPEPNAALYEVTYAQSGEQALQFVENAIRENNPFVGGFFDVKLGPGIDGIETIRRAKEIDPSLLCVIVTAYQDRNIDDIHAVFGEDYADRWDFLAKPFSHAEIQQKARILVKHWDRRKREKEYLAQIQTQQQQLVQSERLAAVGTLSRGIGHEFGNILLAMLGKADFALQSRDPKQMEEALSSLVGAIERAGVIVRNLQAMVKIQVQKAKVAMSTPIQESLSLMVHEFKKNRIQVVENIAPNLPTLTMNKIEMGQVFLNLFINAVHAMEEKGGKLTIRAIQDGKTLQLEVSDEGCGIPPENISKIFEPLFTTKGEKGTGIGLSVCKKIIENHLGTVTVQSVLKKGSTFTLRFPL